MKFTQEEIDDKITTLNDLHKEVQDIKSKQPEAIMGYRLCVFGVLNAYREGDLSFKEIEVVMKDVVCLDLGLCGSEEFPTERYKQEMVDKNSVNYIVGAFIKGLITNQELNEMLVVL